MYLDVANLLLHAAPQDNDCIQISLNPNSEGVETEGKRAVSGGSYGTGGKEDKGVGLMAGSLQLKLLLSIVLVYDAGFPDVC